MEDKFSINNGCYIAYDEDNNMQKEIKVSICITFYNQKKYVDECIQSIIAQKRNFVYEILIGDDGSEDGTYELLQEWEKKVPEICLFRLTREKNVKYYGSERASKNRLFLLKHVKGEYFLFLDGDDYYCDNSKIQLQVNYMDSIENQDCTICGHNVFKYNGVENIAMNGEERIVKYSAKQYWEHIYIHPDSMMFRSKYIDQIPWDMASDNFNDNFITFCFLRNGKILYLPNIMAAYRQTGNGIWTGETNAIGFLRNLIDFDLEIKTDKSFYNSSCNRHFYDFMFFVKNRKMSVEEKYTHYYHYAIKNGLRYTEKFGKGKISYSFVIFLFANRMIYKIKKIIKEKKEYE